MQIHTILQCISWCALLGSQTAQTSTPKNFAKSEKCVGDYKVYKLAQNKLCDGVAVRSMLGLGGMQRCEQDGECSDPERMARFNIFPLVDMGTCRIYFPKRIAAIS